MKKLEYHYIRLNLLSEYFLLYQWFPNERKLSSYLVRAKLYLLERKRGSCKGNNLRCPVCNNIEEIVAFPSTVTCESFNINHHLCCINKCLVHLLKQKVCKKQYTGKTVDRFRLRWNNYKEIDRKFLRDEEIKQKSVHDHFLREIVITALKEMLTFVSLINLTFLTLIREYYWMRNLKTIALFRLNTEEIY